jgi:hypothetical protein
LSHDSRSCGAVSGLGVTLGSDFLDQTSSNVLLWISSD